MDFPEFVQKVSAKIGPNNAFDIARDARITALQKLLIEKGMFTKDEIEAALSGEFEKIAKDIVKMPTLPNKMNSK